MTQTNSPQEPYQYEDKEVWQLLNEFTASIPAVGIGEARNELEEKLEQLIIQKQLEARLDELEKIDDKASSMTFSKGYGGSVWYRLAELRQSDEEEK